MTDIDFLSVETFDFSIVSWVILGVLLFFFLVQILFYLLVYKKPASYEDRREKVSVENDNWPSFSVVIASKNESENLSKHLPIILEQNYPNFEVIVVNMGSTDETDILLKSFDQKYPNLYHTYVPAGADDVNEKKLALTLGIKAANNDILLFTEAYCEASSGNWIREFAKEFANGKEIVLGYCKLVIDKKVSMREFILYDNMIHALKYLSMAIFRKPFMGIGRNLAYKKEIFFEEKGFSSVLNIEGGEDDLFINKIAKKKKIGVAISPDSMTQTGVVEKFTTWRALKSKYLYTKQFYKGFSSFVFWLDTFSKYFFLLAAISGMAFGIYSHNYILFSLSILLIVARFSIQLNVMNKNARLFGVDKLHVNLFFYDIFHPFNNLKFRKYANRRNKFKR